MTIFRKLTLLLTALPLSLAPTLAHAGGWEYYEDGYGGSYYSENYDNGYHSDGDAAAALGLGLAGGMALGAIAATPGPAATCYRARRTVWNEYRGVYQRRTVRVCE